MSQENVFKAYDIRGISPEEINEPFAKNLGKAIAVFFKAKRVAVGRDMRISSPSLSQALIDGLISQGVDVLDIGQVSTPILNYTIASTNSLDGGIMITASHNPKEFNGFKICKSDAMPVGKGSGMEELKEIALKGEFEAPAFLGKIEYKDILPEYLDKIFGLVNISALKPLTVAVDCGNAVNGPITLEIVNQIKQIKLLPLYFEPDGNFPHHEANPLKYETLKDLQTRVVTQNADIGFAFDGDGDRLGVIDELGEIIPGDLLTAVIAEHLLKREENKGKLFYYDLRSSWVVKEVIEKNGGKAEACPVGHAFIKNLMKENKAIFAGELSCHFYYRQFFNVESGDLSMLTLLEILSEQNKPLSEIIKPLRIYFPSGEINVQIQPDNKDKIFQELENKYAGQSKQVSRLDGLKIEHDNFWFNVRASNTEPVLRLNLEAKTKEEMEKKRDEILEILKKY